MARAADARTTAAQMTFLAEVAPAVCADYKTDVEAVAADLAAAQVDPHRLRDDDGPATGEAAKAFEGSVQRDQEAACQQIWTRPGDGGLGLVVSNDDDDQ